MIEAKRTYYWNNNRGIKQNMVLTYKLYHDSEGNLQQVVNQNDYTIEKNSECFDYFKKK